MEYTKDLVLNVNYGQASVKTKKRHELLDKMSDIIRKNKLITIIIGTTTMLISLDFILINSFLNILVKI